MKIIYRFLEFTVFLLTCALVIIVAAAVVFRYVIGQSLFWGTELPNFLFMWMVFLGTAIAFRSKLHISFHFLLKSLKPGTRKPIEIVSLFLMIAFFGFLVVTGIDMVITNMESETEALKIPYGLVYICVPAASLLMFIHACVELVKNLRGE